jgi:cytidylate kinase
VAQHFGWRYIDSGAMYRVVAWWAQDQGIAWTNEAALTCLCMGLTFAFSLTEGQSVIAVNGRDVSSLIRTQRVSMGASQVARLKGVRQVLVRKQQELGAAGGVVMEGRDIGTVVFPHADVKFYLDATPEVRGYRRWVELQGRGGQESLAEVLADVQRRDHDDRTREVSPLRVPEGAHYIDTTNLSVDEVFTLMVDTIEAFSISSRGPAQAGEGNG